MPSMSWSTPGSPFTHRQSREADAVGVDVVVLLDFLKHVDVVVANPSELADAVAVGRYQQRSVPLRRPKEQRVTIGAVAPGRLANRFLTHTRRRAMQIDDQGPRLLAVVARGYVKRISLIAAVNLRAVG